MNRKTNSGNSIMAALAALIALTTAVTGSAQIINPADAQAATGKTYGEWSAVWWQYVLSKNANDPNNPLLSSSGAGCGADQPRGSPVFFLAGAPSNDPLTRDECVVPAGKALFFPLMNAFDVHTPGDGLDTPELVWQDLQGLFGPITALHASIDGVPVAADLFTFDACAGAGPGCAPSFSLLLPGNNLFVWTPAGVGRGGPPGLRGGIYSPAAADGFYLMLEPLSPGAHTLSFGGEGFFGGDPLSQQVTYNLVVKPH